MNESDILEIISLLKSGMKSKNWADIEEAKEYLEEFLTIRLDEEDY